MSVKSARTGREAVPSIQDRVALYTPITIKQSTPRRASSVQPRSHTPSLLSGPRSFNQSMPPPPMPNKTQRDLDNFKSWVEEAISKQKSDIARIDSAVDRIETGLQSFQQLIKEIRAELTTNRLENPTQDDIAAIREDINGFRDELASYQQAQQPRQHDLSVIQSRLNELRRDVDLRFEPDDDFKHKFGVMIKDIQIVDGRTRAVELLKEELRYLKSRLKSLENRTQSVSLAKLEELDGEHAVRDCSAATFDLIIQIPDEHDTTEVENQSTFVDPKQLLLERTTGTPPPKTVLKRPRKKPAVGKRSMKANARNSPDPTDADPDPLEPTGSVVEEENMAPTKREWKDDDSSDELADPEPPKKKTRRSINNLASVKIAADTLKLPSIVISSDHVVSPILGQIDVNEKPNATSDGQTSVQTNPASTSGTIKPALSEVRGPETKLSSLSPAKPRGMYYHDASVAKPIMLIWLVLLNANRPSIQGVRRLGRRSPPFVPARKLPPIYS